MNSITPQQYSNESMWQAKLAKLQRMSIHAIMNSSGGGTGNITFYQFTIGDGGTLTPTAGSTQYLNPGMVNSTDTNTKISLNGQGFLVLNTDFTFEEGGGFNLIGERTFDDQTVYTIIITQ